MIYQAFFAAFSRDFDGMTLVPCPNFAMLFAAADHFDHPEERGIIDTAGAGGQIEVMGVGPIMLEPTWQWCEWGLMRSEVSGPSAKDQPYLRVGGAGMPTWRLTSFAGYLRARGTFLVLNEGAMQAQQQTQGMMGAVQREAEGKARIHQAIVRR